MDDITNERFKKVEAKIEAKGEEIKQELGQQIAEVKVDFGSKLSAMFKVMEASIAAGFQGQAELAKVYHMEQMRRFQAVTDEAERIGAANQRDRRLSALEAEMEEVRTQLEVIKSHFKDERKG